MTISFSYCFLGEDQYMPAMMVAGGVCWKSGEVMTGSISPPLYLL